MLKQSLYKIIVFGDFPLHNWLDPHLPLSVIVLQQFDKRFICNETLSKLCFVSDFKLLYIMPICPKLFYEFKLIFFYGFYENFLRNQNFVAFCNSNYYLTFTQIECNFQNFWVKFRCVFKHFLIHVVFFQIFKFYFWLNVWVWTFIVNVNVSFVWLFWVFSKLNIFWRCRFPKLLSELSFCLILGISFLSCFKIDLRFSFIEVISVLSLNADSDFGQMIKIS